MRQKASRIRRLSWVSKAQADARDVVLYKRGEGCTPMWHELYRRQDLREDLIKMVPRIDDPVDEIVVRLSAESIEDQYVEIRKSEKANPKMTDDESHDVDVRKAAHDATKLADIIIKSQAEKLRKDDPSLTAEQAESFGARRRSAASSWVAGACRGVIPRQICCILARTTGQSGGLGRHPYPGRNLRALRGAGKVITWRPLRV